MTDVDPNAHTQFGFDPVDAEPTERAEAWSGEQPAEDYPYSPESAPTVVAEGRSSTPVVIAAVILSAVAIVFATVVVVMTMTTPAGAPVAGPVPTTPTTQARLNVPPGADQQGFLDSYARCDPGTPPALIASTAKSLVVVCQTRPGSYYYRGVNRSDGQHIELANAVRYSYGFDVTNPTDGTRYEMRPDVLKIVSPGGRVDTQPMTQYATS